MGKLNELKKEINALKKDNKDLEKDREFLESLYQTSLVCQKADKISTVFKIIGRELQKLNLGVTIYFLDKDKQNLIIKYSTLRNSLQLLKELTGTRITKLKFPLQKLVHYQRLIDNGKGYFFKRQSLRRLLEEVFLITPHSLEKDGQTLIKPVRSFIDGVIKKRIWTISIPMGTSGERIGLFEVYANDLAKDDLPVLTIFAHQISNTLRNLKSSQKILLLNRKLEERVARRTKRLLEVLHSKSQFIANASHELRTPLSVIQANWDLFNLLFQKQHHEISPEQQEIAENIREQIGKLARLIEDLLLLAREDSGAYRFEKVKFDFTGLINYVINKMKILAEKRKIVICPDLPEMQKISGDPKMLEKVIENLLFNAIKYSRRKSQIDVRLKKCNHREVRLQVADNGMGIASEILPHIFDHFYRGSKPRARMNSSGSGLGLTICRWIVEAHQGKIRVKSKLGEGSRFSVYLPIDN